MSDSLDAPFTVIMFSTADWDAPYWTNKQHIADRLAKRGHRVLYVESPGIRPPQGNIRDLSRIWARLRRAFRPPRRVTDNLWVFPPLTIPFGHRSRLVKQLNAGLIGSVVRHWLRRHGRGETLVWAYHPYIEGVYEALPRRALVYHCVDDLAAIPGVEAATFKAAETVLARAADVVFTTSPHLKDHCEALGAKRCLYERNVADIDHFAKAREPGRVPEEIARIEGPRLCYAGVLSDYKLDLKLIHACAAARPDLNWIFIGDEPERQASHDIALLRQLLNVHFLGYRTYNELPDYLRGADIAVLPNLTDGYMKGVFPMKFYEYLAAGKPVIATPIESLTDTGAPVVMAYTSADWLAAIDLCLSNPPPAVALDDENLRQFDWENRLDRMLEGVGLHNPNRPVPADHL